jgi:hypothetical protein
MLSHEIESQTIHLLLEIANSDKNIKSFKHSIIEATNRNGGDLTDKVEIDDNVNLKKSGTYMVHYFVTDSNGAKGHSVLNVIVK